MKVKEWHGIYAAVVVNNHDPANTKRVTAQVPQVLGTAFSNWCNPVVAGSGTGPAVGTQIYVMFAGGDPDYPYTSVKLEGDMSEILFPFSLSQSGGIAVTGEDPELIAQQHVDALVSTAPSERVMLPTYGIPLAANLFHSDPSVISASLAQDVSQAMATWEPAIQVLGVTPTFSDQSEGRVAIDVDYTIGTGPVTVNNVNTATVLVGGDVIEVIRSQS